MAFHRIFTAPANLSKRKPNFAAERLREKPEQGAMKDPIIQAVDGFLDEGSANSAIQPLHYGTQLMTVLMEHGKAKRPGSSTKVRRKNQHAKNFVNTCSVLKGWN